MTVVNPLFKKFAEKYGVDQTKVGEILKATAFRQKKDSAPVTDEQMIALLVVADQYGLNPFTREIFAYPDKQNGIVPVIGLDGWSRIINNHPQMDGMELKASDRIVEMEGAKPCPEWLCCTIYRKDRGRPISIPEYLDEVYRPAFVGTDKQTGERWTSGGPWQSHTKRMLRHKAIIQCARIAFGFVGIYDQDEAERIIEGEAVREPGYDANAGAEGAPSSPTELVVSDAVKAQVTRVVERAKKSSSWAAGKEYMLEHFKGDELAFALRQLKIVEEEAKVLAAQTGASQAPAPAAEPKPSEPAKAPKATGAPAASPAPAPAPAKPAQQPAAAERTRTAPLSAPGSNGSMPQNTRAAAVLANARTTLNV